MFTIDIESKTILFLGSILGIIIGVIFLFQYLFADNEHDFIQAKTTKKVIICKGLFKTYILKPKQYTVYENHIAAKIMLVNRTFKLSQCNIEDKKIENEIQIITNSKNK